MDAPRYFARRYFAGRYWPPSADAPAGYISGSFAGSSSWSGSIAGDSLAEELIVRGRRKQRRRLREDKDLRDLQAIVDRLMRMTA